MLISEVYDLYGSWAQLSKQLNIGSTTYQAWLRRGYIPLKMQETIEVRTKGKVVASIEHLVPQDKSLIKPKN